MVWLRGSWVKWAIVGAGLLTTSCVGVVGAGAAVVVVGAGVLSMTCYDRVSVTVTDQLTGTKLCDAKVTFTEDGSVTEATSCYTAALSNGHYKMRVERRGLVPYEMPVDIDTGKSCKHAVQTIWVALDRPNYQKPPQQIAPEPLWEKRSAAARAAAPASAAPVDSTTPAPAPTPSAAPSASAPAASFPTPPAASAAPAPTPSAAPAPRPSAAPPAAGTFPAVP